MHCLFPVAGIHMNSSKVSYCKEKFLQQTPGGSSEAAEAKMTPVIFPHCHLKCKLKQVFCNLPSFSGAEIQPGPVCEQALPGPGKDCEEQQAGGPHQSQNTWLERRHGSCRRLLWCPRRVQHRLVRKGHVQHDKVWAVSLPSVTFASMVCFSCCQYRRMSCTIIISEIFREVHPEHFDVVPALLLTETALSNSMTIVVREGLALMSELSLTALCL